MSSETSAARVEGDRILSIDVVRGMAVLGILLMIAQGLANLRMVLNSLGRIPSVVWIAFVVAVAPAPDDEGVTEAIADRLRRASAPR